MADFIRPSPNDLIRDGANAITTNANTTRNEIDALKSRTDAVIETVELPTSPELGKTITVLATEDTQFPTHVQWDSPHGLAPTVGPGERLICGLVWDGYLWRGTYGLPYPRIIFDSFTANSGTPVGARPMDTGETWTIAGGEYEIRAVNAPDDLRARKITNSATQDHDTVLVRWGTPDVAAPYDMRVSADGMHGAKLVARAVDSQNFYQLEVSVHGELHVGHMTDGVRVWMAKAFRTATPGARYALEVTTAPVGAAVTVYENGEVIWTGTDTRSQRPVGRWGGFVIATTVGYLDNLKIEAP